MNDVSTLKQERAKYKNALTWFEPPTTPPRTVTEESYSIMNYSEKREAWMKYIEEADYIYPFSPFMRVPPGGWEDVLKTWGEGWKKDLPMEAPLEEKSESD